MEEKVKVTLLGGFVIGGIIAVIFLLIFFSTQRVLQRGTTFVLYFSSDVKGLHIGSPVEFRGIKIGEVTDIKLIIDAKTEEISVPVSFQFLKGIFKANQEKHSLDLLIKMGLRAQLVTNNLVTGELGINLAMEPGTPEIYHKTKEKVFEIPTLPSKTQDIILRETLKKVEKAFDEMSDFLKSRELRDPLNKVGNAFDDMSHFLKSQELREPLNSITLAFTDTSKLMKNINNDFSPLSIQLVGLLKEFQKSARDIGVVAEYLSRHPEALIRGKQE